MRRTGKWLAGIIVVLFVLYLAGPKPPKPDFTIPDFNLPANLNNLESKVNHEEQMVKGLKPDNQARIVWADSTMKHRTKIAFLYLHGFSASQAEGEPVHRDLAKKYNANLFLSRLAEHGINRGDSSMINLTASELELSAEKALAITEELGEEVVVIGTSAGGTLALFLASRHPEIKALVLYSPCVKLYDPSAFILDKHWGLSIARLFAGGPDMKFKAESKEHENYWQLDYRIESLVALENLLSNTMKPSVFLKIRCPVYLGYYCKDEQQHDKTVSVPAMLKMFDELGTPGDLKVRQAFPEAGAHVIASAIRSKDWKDVEKGTIKFLSERVKL